MNKYHCVSDKDDYVFCWADSKTVKVTISEDDNLNAVFITPADARAFAADIVAAADKIEGEKT